MVISANVCLLLALWAQLKHNLPLHHQLSLINPTGACLRLSSISAATKYRDPERTCNWGERVQKTKRAFSLHSLSRVLGGTLCASRCCPGTQAREGTGKRKGLCVFLNITLQFNQFN